MKKIISILLVTVIALTFTFPLTAQQQSSTQIDEQTLDFSQFRGNTMAQGIVDSKTPLTAENTFEKWATSFGSGWSDTPGTPIIVGENLYVVVPGQKKLYRVNKNSGEILQSVDSPGESQFFSIIGYGDGVIFVPRQVKIDGKFCVVIQAYDEKSMEAIWQTAPIGDPNDGLSPVCGITYYEGYIYLGASNGSANKGAYACFSVIDEDKLSSSEVKKAVWEYSPQAPAKSGYYWSSAVIVGGAIVFGGESSELVIHSLTTPQIYDKLTLENDANGGIRSALYFDAQSRRIFAASKSGNVFSVKINGNNTFDTSSIVTKKIGNNITSSPVCYGGRVYLGGGGAGANGGFLVLDAETLEIIYNIPEVKTQSSPIITTGYATPQNGYEVNIYVVKFDKSNPSPSCLYRITDSAGQMTPNFEAIAVPSKLNYCSQSVAIDGDGSIYFYNDGGKIFSFANKLSTAYTPADVDVAIEKMSKNEKINGTDLFSLSRIMSRYNLLSKDEQKKVTKFSDLERMIEATKQQNDQSFLVGSLNEAILKIDISSITIKDDANITELISNYNKLTDQNKSLVIGYDILLKASEKLTEIKDKNAITNLSEQIKSLPKIDEISLDDTSRINSVFNFFSVQNDNVKSNVDSKKLLSLNEKIVQLQAKVDKINNRIFNELNPMNITLSDEKTVDEIMKMYEELSNNDKKYIVGYEEVLAAKEQIDALKKLPTDEKPLPQPPTVTTPQTADTTALLLSFATLILFAGATFTLKKANKNNKY
ncbi:MAG: PQQ-binding-like beta-propeller repeat protein [Oscillospiraceae bacterium]